MIEKVTKDFETDHWLVTCRKDLPDEMLVNGGGFSVCLGRLRLASQMPS